MIYLNTVNIYYFVLDLFIRQVLTEHQLTLGPLWATEKTGLNEMIRVFGLMLLCSMGRRQAIVTVLYLDNGLSCRVLKLSVLDLSSFPFPLPLTSFSCIIAFWDSAVLGKSKKLHICPIQDFGSRDGKSSLTGRCLRPSDTSCLLLFHIL